MLLNVLVVKIAQSLFADRFNCCQEPFVRGEGRRLQVVSAFFFFESFIIFFCCILQAVGDGYKLMRYWKYFKQVVQVSVSKLITGIDYR